MYTPACFLRRSSPRPRGRLGIARRPRLESPAPDAPTGIGRPPPTTTARALNRPGTAAAPPLPPVSRKGAWCQDGLSLWFRERVHGARMAYPSGFAKARMSGRLPFGRRATFAKRGLACRRVRCRSSVARVPDGFAKAHSRRYPMSAGRPDLLSRRAGHACISARWRLGLARDPGPGPYRARRLPATSPSSSPEGHSGTPAEVWSALGTDAAAAEPARVF